MKRYLTVPTLISHKVTRARDLGGLRSPTVESAIVRKERLGLVKEELLSEKEDNLRGEFLRSPRAPVDNPFDDKRVSDDEESLILKMELGAKQGVEAPSKAILKRNTTGRMVMRGVVKDEDGQRIGGPDDGDYLIKDAPMKATNTRLKPPSAINKLKMAGTNDPTMMSGGLRMSGRGIGNEGLIAAPQQTAGGGRIDVAAWKNLEGLRKGDPLIERGMDRQSFVSGWQGSTTSVSSSLLLLHNHTLHILTLITSGAPTSGNASSASANSARAESAWKAVWEVKQHCQTTTAPAASPSGEIP